MAEATPTGRRWFQFSLTSLFVVTTLVAIWLGWELKVVRDRQTAKTWILELGGFVEPWVEEPRFVKVGAPGDEPWRKKWSRVSRLRTWLGDEPICHISLVDSDATWEQCERIAHQFPEAFVVPERPEGIHRRPKHVIDRPIR